MRHPGLKQQIGLLSDCRATAPWHAVASAKAAGCLLL